MSQSEFELIGRYFAALGAERGDVRLGVGDDGAVVSPPHARDLVVVTDSLVESVRFPKGSPAASIVTRTRPFTLSALCDDTPDRPARDSATPLPSASTT